jgi:hypothetical protein
VTEICWKCFQNWTSLQNIPISFRIQSQLKREGQIKVKPFCSLAISNLLIKCPFDLVQKN